MTEEQQQQSDIKKQGGLREIVVVIIQTVLVVFVFRTFLFQPFVIPSGSMRPTLLVGDYLFVAKYSYGYSRYSFPYAPNLFSGRIFGSEPKRGDIVVFRQWSKQNGQEVDFIKRLVGMPGDRIQMRESELYINDVAVPRVKVGTIADRDVTEVDWPVDMYRETLPNGVTYNTLDLIPDSAVDNTREFVVPEGHYFMMGDNRDNSDDSRLNLSYISYDRLLGRANLIFFSVGNNAAAWQVWRWPFDIRWNRLFSWVTTIQYFPPDKQ